jgi:creatinine amidohydrolase
MMVLSVTSFLSACTRRAPAEQDRVYALETLSSAAVAALDPSRTAFILEIAPLEAHGPHLPIGNDSYQGIYAARRMAEQMADSLPGWSIVLLPALWYGVDGANRIPEREDIRGTFSLRPATLRAFVADIGSQVADHGFRWLFLVHVHGAPLEHVALSDAADFVRDTRGIGVYDIGTLEYMASTPSLDSFIASRLSSADRARIGFDIHAGFTETSTTLAVRPDLVSPGLRSMPDVTVSSWEELLQAGRRPGWSGYWSAPALADSVVGRMTLDSWAARWTHFALRAIRGEDVSRLPHYPGGMQDNPVIQMSDRSVARQRTFDAQFAEWVAKRSSRIDYRSPD